MAAMIRAEVERQMRKGNGAKGAGGSSSSSSGSKVKGGKVGGVSSSSSSTAAGSNVKGDKGEIDKDCAPCPVVRKVCPPCKKAAGWSQWVDAISGKFYYYNADTKQSVWTKPREMVSAEERQRQKENLPEEKKKNDVEEESKKIEEERKKVLERERKLGEEDKKVLGGERKLGDDPAPCPPGCHPDHPMPCPLGCVADAGGGGAGGAGGDGAGGAGTAGSGGGMGGGGGEPGEMIESKVTFMYPLTDTDQFSVKLGYAKQAGVLLDHVEIRQYDGLSEESTCQDVPGYKSKKGRTCKSWAMAAAAKGAAQNRAVKSAKVKAAVAKAAAAQAAAAVAAAESSGTIFSRAQATTGV